MPGDKFGYSRIDSSCQLFVDTAGSNVRVETGGKPIPPSRHGLTLFSFVEIDPSKNHPMLT